MTAREFCYWLQGYFELNKKQSAGTANPALSPEQTQCIENHLALVFKHEIDPSAGSPEHQAALSALHQGLTVDDVKELIKEHTPGRPPHSNTLLRC